MQAELVPEGTLWNEEKVINVAKRTIILMAYNLRYFGTSLWIGQAWLLKNESCQSETIFSGRGVDLFFYLPSNTPIPIVDMETGLTTHKQRGPKLVLFQNNQDYLPISEVGMLFRTATFYAQMAAKRYDLNVQTGPLTVTFPAKSFAIETKEQKVA